MEDWEKEVLIRSEVHKYLVKGLSTDEIATLLKEPIEIIDNVKRSLEQNVQRKIMYENARSMKTYQKMHEEYLEQRRVKKERAEHRRTIIKGIKSGYSEKEIKDLIPDIRPADFNELYRRIVESNTISDEEWLEVGEMRKVHRKELESIKRKEKEEQKEDQKNKEQNIEKVQEKTEEQEDEIIRLKRLAKQEFQRELSTGETNIPTKKREKYRDAVVKRFEKKDLDLEFLDYDVLIETMAVHNDFVTTGLIKTLIMSKYKEEGIIKAKHLSQQLASELRETKYGPKLLQYSSQLEKYIDPIEDRLL